MMAETPKPPTIDAQMAATYVEYATVNANKPLAEISARQYQLHGIFTGEIAKGRLIVAGLFRDGVIGMINSMGYFKRIWESTYIYYVRDVDNVLDKVQIFEIRDEFREFIDSIEDSTFTLNGVTYTISAIEMREVYLKQQHLIFCDTFLSNLPTHHKEILQDERARSHYLFRNGIFSVSADKVDFTLYKEQDKAIWRSQIKDFDLDYKLELEEYNDCHFAQFICNSMGDDFAAMVSAIGYVLHNRNLSSGRKAIILNDAAITDSKRPQGGSGKGIVVQAISQVRKVVVIDGRRLDEGDKFKYQQCEEDTQILVLDDLKPQFSVDSLFSAITEGLSVEKKHQPTIKLNPEFSPKIVITSNVAISGEGTSYKRRFETIELSDYYSSRGGDAIRDVHGCEFFTMEWDAEEWNKFYCYMLGCVRVWLKKGFIKQLQSNLLINKLRQSTSDDFAEFVQAKKIERGAEYQTAEMFQEFRATYYGDDTNFKQRGFTNWLKTYAIINSMKFKTYRSNNVSLFKLE